MVRVMRDERLVPAVAVAGLTVLAVLVAVAGAFVHRWSPPWGFALAVGGAAGVAVLARASARTRAGMAVVALAWLVPVVVFAQSPPGGDLIITDGTAGLVLLFGGSVCHAITVGLGARRDRWGSVT